MNPVKFEMANLVLGQPKNWDEEKMGVCQPLYLYHNEGELHSIWKPTEEELAILAQGGGVVLTVIGNGHPVVRLGVAEIEPVENFESVEPTHEEVVDQPLTAKPLDSEDEHDTIEDAAEKNTTEHHC